MTDARPVKKPRWSRGQIRFLAWVSGSAAFLSFFGALGLSPKPAVANGAVAAAGRRPLPRQKIIIRKIIRRVVIVDPPVADLFVRLVFVHAHLLEWLELLERARREEGPWRPRRPQRPLHLRPGLDRWLDSPAMREKGRTREMDHIRHNVPGHGHHRDHARALGIGEATTTAPAGASRQSSPGRRSGSPGSEARASSHG